MTRINYRIAARHGLVLVLASLLAGCDLPWSTGSDGSGVEGGGQGGTPQPPPPYVPPKMPGAHLPDADRAAVLAYAQAMWNSIQQFDRAGGLPSDKLCLEPNGTTSLTDYTFIANVAAYAWSVVGARDLGIIGYAEGRQKLLPLLDAVESLQRDSATAGAPGGMLAWAAKVDGPRVDGNIVSSVDNGWLAAGLALIAQAYPELKPRAEAILAKMDFAAMLDPATGQFFNNYDLARQAFSSGTYDLLSEARIISYVAIGEGDVPGSQYFRVGRWPAWKPHDYPQQYRQYEGVNVYEYTQTYAGQRFLPTWGGSMFETFSPYLLIPEVTWAPGSWARSHPQAAAAHVRYGLDNFGYWGFSPAMVPATRGYTEYGAPPLGIGGYSPLGQDEAARAGPVVTPHAVFLPIEFEPRATLDNLARLRADFPDVYDAQLGFRDSVDVETGKVSECMLLLDQGMAFGAMVNHLTEGGLRRYLGQRYEAKLQPLIGQEAFWYPAEGTQ